MKLRRVLSILMLLALLATSSVIASAQPLTTKDPLTYVTGSECSISGRILITMHNKTSFIARLSLAQPVLIREEGTNKITEHSEILIMDLRKNNKENIKKKYNKKDYTVTGKLQPSPPGEPAPFALIAPTGAKTVRLTKMKKPTSVKISDTKKSMTNGETFQLSATVNPSAALQIITWSSSKKSVATVDANGLVTAHTKGTAYIYAKSVNGKSKKCKITVTIPGGTIALSSSKLTFSKTGEKKTLKVTANPTSGAKPYTWITTNSRIATINAKGVVTARETGYATITVMSADGRNASCEVVVGNVGGNADSISITLNDGDRALKPGNELPLAIRCNPVYAATPEIDWRSSNTAVATVNANGVVTAVADGVVIIEAKAKNDIPKAMTATTLIAVTNETITSKTLTDAMLVFDFKGTSVKLPMNFNEFKPLVPGGTETTDTYGSIYYQNAGDVNYAYRFVKASGMFSSFCTYPGDTAFKTSLNVFGGSSYEDVLRNYGYPSMSHHEAEPTGGAIRYLPILSYRIVSANCDLTFRIDPETQKVDQISVLPIVKR